MMNPRIRRLALPRISFIILGSFLLFRSLLAILTVEFPSGGLTLDSKSYIDLSEIIRFGGTFQDPVGEEDLRRPPVYPAFLSLFQTKAGLLQPGVSLAQIGLVSAASLLMLWLFMRLGFPTAGLVASWLIALSPNLNLWSLTVMSEILFTFLVSLALVLFLSGVPNSSKTKLLLSGVTLGFATLTRPIGLILFLLWVVMTVILTRRVMAGAVTRSTVFWFLIGCISIILPWMARNAVVHNSFVVSDIGEHTLESFNFAIVLSEAKGISRNDATYQLGELGGTLNQFRWILQNYPVQFVKSQFAGIGRVIWGIEITRWATVMGVQDWFGFGVFRYLRQADFAAAMQNVIETLRTPSEVVLLSIYILSVMHTLILIILSIVGVVKIKSTGPEGRILILICMISAVSMMIVSGAAGQARFRVPVEPFLAVIAGVAWEASGSAGMLTKTDQGLPEPDSLSE